VTRSSVNSNSLREHKGIKGETSFTWFRMSLRLSGHRRSPAQTQILRDAVRYCASIKLLKGNSCLAGAIALNPNNAKAAGGMASYGNLHRMSPSKNAVQDAKTAPIHPQAITRPRSGGSLEVHKPAIRTAGRLRQSSSALIQWTRAPSRRLNSAIVSSRPALNIFSNSLGTNEEAFTLG